MRIFKNNAWKMPRRYWPIKQLTWLAAWCGLHLYMGWLWMLSLDYWAAIYGLLVLGVLAWIVFVILFFAWGF